MLSQLFIMMHIQELSAIFVVVQILEVCMLEDYGEKVFCKVNVSYQENVLCIIFISQRTTLYLWCQPPAFVGMSENVAYK